MRIQTALTLVAFALLACEGCLPPTPDQYSYERSIARRPSYPPFAAAEYASFDGNGDGRIVGRLEKPCADGHSRPISNQLVVLEPVTSYSAVWWRCVATSNDFPTDKPQPDPRAAPYRRTTKTDAEGHFVFDRLYPGSYYVLSRARAGLCDPDAGFAGKVGAEARVEINHETTVTLAAEMKWPLSWSREGCSAEPCPPCSYWKWLWGRCDCP